ncbi:MAG: L-seryl-tRNA(Sec) selenium transferase [Chloroflexi bacterium]|nr:L-seryl-tRNA(Sec) selenium transferase [Chloroflexota bacterium]
MTTSPYRALPSMDRLLADPRLAEIIAAYGHERVADQARGALEEARQAIGNGGAPRSADELVAVVLARARAQWQPGLRRVINATGVVIHTNLGRAPLSREAVAAMALAAQGYSNLEFDLESGERGSRHVHIEALLTQLTGAEAALVVNNNASAVLLGLTALAQGKEVIVSRGQAVEIGGGFRIPDVLRQSGARLVEVGTTNRTYVGDYDAAISHETAALLRVHSSNFRVIGFTHSAALPELVELAHRRGLLALDDLGSGCLLDTTAYGLAKEPLVQESVEQGADLVFFSGDKLLGGPQAGIIVGRKAPVEWLKRHPLARAVRIDKASLAGLAATLTHYLKNKATERVPVWQMIAAPLERLEQRASAWAAALRQAPSAGSGHRPLAGSGQAQDAALGEGVAVVDGRSMIGGGSLPEESLPTRLLAISSVALTGGATPEAVAARLRALQPAVVARIERDVLLFDPRTVLPDEDEELVAALRAALAGL